MGEYQRREYLVKDASIVYYSMNMDRTLAWFTDVLGWYGKIDARDSIGIGTYGCAFTLPEDSDSNRISPLAGIHLLHGIAAQRVVGLIRVEGVEKLHDYIVANGWSQIDDVITEPWGTKTCEVTTIDGSKLKFFE